MTYDRYCQRCGSKAISRCPHCSEPIKGSLIRENYNDEWDDYPLNRNLKKVVSSSYTIPYYCPKCHEAYPWVTRFFKATEELLDLPENSIFYEEKKVLMESLPDLLIRSSETGPAVDKWRRFIISANSAIREEIRITFSSVLPARILKILFNGL